jgi:site-specific recombinase XerD
MLFVIGNIPTSKRTRRLPDVFAKEEVKRLFKVVSNSKQHLSLFE